MNRKIIMSSENSYVVPLHATLSIATSSENRLQEAIQNSLSWDYGSDDVHLKAVFLRSPTEAIVFIDNPVAVDKLVTQSLVTLSGPLQATFTFAENLPTEIISVKLNDTSPKIVEQLIRIAKDSSGSSAVFYGRKSGALLKFNTLIALSTVITSLEKNSAVTEVKNVLVGEHRCLECCFKSSSLSLREVILRLERVGHTLTTFIQHCVSLWEEPPLILAVRELYPLNSCSLNGSLSDSYSADLMLICCTANDANILSNRPVIEFPGHNNLSLLVLSQSTASSHDTENITDMEGSTSSAVERNHSGAYLHDSNLRNHYLLTKHECVLLWDLDSCPLLTKNTTTKGSNLLADDISLILSNIDIILSDYVSVVFGEQAVSPISRIAFLPHEHDALTKTSTNQLNALHMHQFKTINYSKKGGVDLGMRSEVDALAGRFHSAEKKPTVCLIIGNTTSSDLVGSSTLAALRLNGFDILLIYSNTMREKDKGRDISSQLNVTAVPWQDVRLLHTYSADQRQSLLQNAHSSTSYTSSPFTSFVSKESDGQPRARKSTTGFETSKAVFNTSMTSSFSGKIRGSGKKDIPYSISHSQSNKTVSETIDLLKFSIATHFKNLESWRNQDCDECGHRSSLLLGEEGSGGPEDSCHLSYDIDSKIKRQNLIISGSTIESVQKRVERIHHMLKLANKIRKVHKLLGWKAEHREAAMGSSPISTLQQKLKTTVVFHITDNIILAEIVSLSNSGHHDMFHALESVQLREDTWTLPVSIMREYKDKQWNLFRNKFAVKVDRGIKFPKNNNISSNEDVITLRVWSFGNLLEYAYLYLTGTSTSTVLQPLDEIEALTAHDMSKTATPHIIGDETGLSVSSVSPSISPHISSFQVSTNYTFQNKDFFTYFCLYQNIYKSYIQQSFGIEIQSIIDPNDNQNNNSSSIVKLQGSSRGVQTCSHYLDKLQGNLIKKLIFFPRTTNEKYKSILEQKTSCEAKLASIRNESPLEENELKNPMEFEGLFSIRVRPPVHSRGIKRMTFPADTTVTLCGMAKSSTMQADVLQMEEQFLALNAELATAEFQVPTRSQYGRKLSIRSHREDFVLTYGLTGLRWEHSEGESTGRVKMWAPALSLFDPVITVMCGDSNISLIQTKQENSTVTVVATSGTMKSSEESSPTTEKSRNGQHASRSPRKDRKSVNGTDEKPGFEALIHWPQPAFRYLFLSDNLKKGLNDLLERLRADKSEPLKITCPYRDKKDSSVCMLLEGSKSAVTSGADNINSYLKSIDNLLQTVALVCSPTQIQTFIADDLSRVKKIQGCAGIHLILDPVPCEISQIAARHEMRLLRPQSAENHDVDLVCVSVPTIITNTPHDSSLPLEKPSVDVSVAYTKADSPGWTWGVNCLLVILEADADIGLSMDDVMELNRGNVSVTSDAFSGKTILRVRLMQASSSTSCMKNWGDGQTSDTSSISSSIKNMSEMNRLCDAIQRGISQADQLNITGLAVVTPIGLVSLSNLTEDNIRVTVVDAVTSYIMKSTVHTLSRVVCLEYLQAVNPELTSAIVPFGNSKLVSAIMSTLESTPKSYLVGCTIPLPPTGHFKIRSKTENIPEEREKIVLLRGLDDSLHSAIKDIKALLLEKELSSTNTLEIASDSRLRCKSSDSFDNKSPLSPNK